MTEAILRERVDAELGVERAVEALREREMLGVAPELIAKHEHRMLVHAGTDLLEGVGVGRCPEIDGAHLGDERRMKLAKCQAAYAHVSLGSRFAAAKQAHTSGGTRAARLRLSARFHREAS